MNTIAHGLVWVVRFVRNIENRTRPHTAQAHFRVAVDERSSASLGTSSAALASRRLGFCFLLLLLFATTTATVSAQSEEALFIIRGTRYQYGFFGQGAFVPPPIGPIDPPFHELISYPGDNTNRSTINQLDVTMQGRNQVEVRAHLESLLRAARLDGNDWGGGADVLIDVYVKGPAGTGFSVERTVDGQVTAVRGAGLGTTHAAGDGVTAVVNNGSGAQSLPISHFTRTMGVTSSQRHPTRWGYYLARTESVSVWGFTYQGIDFCFPGCPGLLNFRSTTDLTMTIRAECLSNQCPQGAELDDWKTPFSNCYNYATNSRSACSFGERKETFAQPGVGGGTPLTPGQPRTCENVAAAARTDGLIGPFSDPNSCPQGTCVVYLVVNPYERIDLTTNPPTVYQRDYHWYRRNADGSWSNKHGDAPAESFVPGVPPSFTDDWYIIGCGYMCVPCDSNLASPRPCPPGGSQGISGGVSATSGEPTPEFPITNPTTIQQLAAALSAGVPTTPPARLPRRGFAGFTLRADASVSNLPGYAIFFDGLIVVYSGGAASYLMDIGGGYALMRRLAADAGFSRYFCGCVADVDDGNGLGVCDGGVTIDDLLFYLDTFADGVARADLDDGSSTGTPDGGVTIDDLLYFLLRYEAGC